MLRRTDIHIDRPVWCRSNCGRRQVEERGMDIIILSITSSV